MDIFKCKICIFLLVAAVLFFAGQSLLAEEIKVTTLAPGNQWVKSQETGHENDIYASNTVDPTYGNVGIGTSAPVSLLDVNSKLNVLSGGSVGIGTTTPISLLHVNSAGTAAITLTATAGGTSVFTLENNWSGAGNGAGFDVYDATNNAVRFKITPLGNVGIGTAAPADKFSVGGKVLISDSTNPASPPSGSVVIYFDGIDLKAKNSAGRVEDIAKF